MRNGFSSEATPVVAAFLFVALLVGAYYVGVKGEGRSAFNRWRPVLQELARGEDIYYRYAFPTPPIMALVLYPFALLPGKWGMTAWFLFKTGLTVWVLRWVVEMTSLQGGFRPFGPVGSEEQARAGSLGPAESATQGARVAEAARREAPPGSRHVVLLVALLLAVRPVIGDLLHGNVNLWILFLVVGAFRLFQRGRDWSAGLVLALAAASKLTPALLIGYFLWKRCWRVVAGAMVGLVIWLVVVPGCLLGPARNLILLEHWGRMMVWPYLVEGRVDTEHVNQSLPGLVYRLTTSSPAIEADEGQPAVFVHFVALEQRQARRVLGAITLTCALVLGCLCRSVTAERSDPRLLYEFSLVLMAMLLLSERSWKHHYVTLLPVYFALVSEAWQASHSAGRRLATGLWTLLGVSALAMSATSKDAVDLLCGRGASDLAEAYGAYIWAAVALALGCIWALRTRNLSACRGGVAGKIERQMK